MGITVGLYRYVHVLVGGAFAGVAGACYSLAIAPGWGAGDGPVRGAGWGRAPRAPLRGSLPRADRSGRLAVPPLLAAFWRAELCLLGAYLFGGLSALPFALQAHDVTVTP